MKRRYREVKLKPKSLALVLECAELAALVDVNRMAEVRAREERDKAKLVEAARYL